LIVWLCVIPLITSVLINLTNMRESLLKKVSLISCSISFLLSLNLWLFYDKLDPKFQFVSDLG